MSKILILTFVVLVTSVSNESSPRQNLLSVRKRVRLYFATEKSKFEAEYNTANLTITENTRKLLEGAESINRNLSERKRDIWNKVERNTSEIIVKTLGTAGAEQCYSMYTDVDVNGQILLSEVNECTQGVLNTAFENVAETKVMYERLQQTLLNWKNRLRVCPYFDQYKRVALCMETIEAQTKLQLAKSSPQVSAKIDATNNLLTTLLSSINNCASDYYDYELKVPDMIARATLCYNRKLKEAAHLVDVA